MNKPKMSSSFFKRIATFFFPSSTATPSAKKNKTTLLSTEAAAKPNPSKTNNPFRKDDSQKYYGFMPLRKDEQGLVSSYSLPFQTIHTGDRPLQRVNDSLRLRCNSKASGKDRLANFQWAERNPGVPALLVSENVKCLLMSFDLPAHVFHFADLDTPRIEEVETDYFVLQLGYDSLLKDLRYPVRLQGISSRFNAFSRTRKEIISHESPDLPNYEAFEIESRRLQKEGVPYGYPALIPYRFELDTAYDIYSYEDEIIINEFVKDALDRHFPGEFKTYDLNLPPIQINPNNYADKRVKYVDLTVPVEPIRYTFSEDDEARFATMGIYLKGNYEVPDEAYSNDEFSADARRLKLVFPEKFKDFYRKGLPCPTYWEMENLNRIYPLEDMEFSGPEAAGAIAFAGNGAGDHLALSRLGHSPFELGDIVYFADHETDELSMIGPLEDLYEWIVKDSDAIEE